MDVTSFGVSPPLTGTVLLVCDQSSLVPAPLEGKTCPLHARCNSPGWQEGILEQHIILSYHHGAAEKLPRQNK